MNFRRKTALLLSFCLLAGTLAACDNGNGATPSVPSGSGGKPGSAAASGSAALTVCVEKEFRELTKELCSYSKSVLKNGTDIQTEILPEEADKREATFKRMRTELMAGKGPDLFLLAATPPWNTLSGGQRQEAFFPDLNKSLSNGMFCDLNPFLEKSTDFNPGDFIGPVMEAGVRDGKRYALPIACSWNMAAVEKSAFDRSGIDARTASEGPESFLKAVRVGKDPLVSAKLRILPLLSFYESYATPIDYGSGKAAVTEDALLTRLREMMKFYSELPLEQDSSGEHVPFGDAKNPVSAGKAWNVLLDIGKAAETKPIDCVLLPFPSDNGKVTAGISLYGAVRANSENKQAACDFLELFLSKEIQSGKGYRVTNGDYDSFYGSGGFFIGLSLMPVRRDILKDWLLETTSLAENTLPATLPQSLADAEKQIGAAHFYCTADADAYDAVQVAQGLPYSKDPSDETALKKATAKLYKTIREVTEE